jgi:hypothetical protein
VNLWQIRNNTCANRLPALKWVTVSRSLFGFLFTATATFLLVSAQSQISTAPIPPAGAAATVSSSSQPMTTDPAQLLDLAAQLNGLDGPDVKPWHVKATYETFDDEGKSKATGTFEE